MALQGKPPTVPGSNPAQVGAGWRCVKSEEFGQTFIYEPALPANSPSQGAVASPWGPSYPMGMATAMSAESTARNRATLEEATNSAHFESTFFMSPLGGDGYGKTTRDIPSTVFSGKPAPPLGDTQAITNDPYVSSGGTMVAQAPAIENQQHFVGNSGLLASSQYGAPQPTAAGTATGPVGGLTLSVNPTNGQISLSPVAPPGQMSVPTPQPAYGLVSPNPDGVQMAHQAQHRALANTLQAALQQQASQQQAAQAAAQQQLAQVEQSLQQQAYQSHLAHQQQSALQSQLAIQQQQAAVAAQQQQMMMGMPQMPQMPAMPSMPVMPGAGGAANPLGLY